VILWNNACREILGYTREEVAASPDAMGLFYPDPEVRSIAVEAIHLRDGYFREFVVRRKDGKLLRQMWANFALPDNTSIGVGYDITAIRRTEEELVRINQTLEQKAEERTQKIGEQRAQLANSSKFSALGEMAGGIAHEINTPLATISLVTDQLKDLLQDDSPDLRLAQRMTDRIHATTQRIARIISALGSFSRNGATDPFVEISVRKIVDDVILLCGEKMKHGLVELQVAEIAPDLTLECRPVEISQILLNLLNNSYDAVSSHKTKWILIGVKDLGSSIQISVTDSGPGIPSEIREKLFQPFFTTKDVGKGTGIGLSISKKIAEEHNGTLKLTSNPLHEKETCFALTLPKKHERPKS
jgi:PAS domain S-box-containing protein